MEYWNRIGQLFIDLQLDQSQCVKVQGEIEFNQEVFYAQKTHEKQ